MNVIIKASNIDLTSGMRKFIEEKIQTIDKFYPNIMEVRVEIEHDAHHQKGNVYRCEANVNIPGKILRVEKSTTDFKKAVNKVKDHLKIVLTKEKEKQFS
ncbi:MAG: ribosome-associated translation inhibitor RaiA [Candidatus Komeilibacteria bacterium]